MAGPYSIGDGGNYEIPSVWESDTQQDMSAGGGVGELRGEMFGAWDYFTARVEIAGATNTSADDYRHLTAQSGQEHSGIQKTGVGFYVDVADAVVEVYELYSGCSWIEVHQVDVDYPAVHWNEKYNFTHYCIIVGGSKSLTSGSSDTGGLAYRDICINPAGDGITLAKAARAYNCTVYGSGDEGIAFKEEDDEIEAKNILSVNSSTNDFGSSTIMVVVECWSEDASGTDQISEGSLAALFEDVTGDLDLHIKASTSVIDQGNDLGSPYDYDIDNEEVTGTWDIGADEYFAAAGGRTTLNTDSNPLGVSVGISWRM